MAVLPLVAPPPPLLRPSPHRGTAMSQAECLHRGCRPRGAHGAPGHVRLAASMYPDAHVRCTSPPHSVPSPGAMLRSMAFNPGYLNDAACAVRGRPLNCRTADTNNAFWNTELIATKTAEADVVGADL